MNLVGINGPADLFAQLARSDPPCAGEMTKLQMEASICAYLLATLAETDRLTYPLTIEHHDRPDFRLYLGAETVGVEVTEAALTDYRDFVALSRRENPDAFLQPGHFRVGTPRRTIWEKRELLSQTSMTSPVWMNDEPEREWSAILFNTIVKKLGAITKNGFVVYPRNWLAIYDATTFRVARLVDAIRKLRLELQPFWAKVPGFCTIFIQSEGGIVEITATECRNSSACRPLADLAETDPFDRADRDQAVLKL